MIRLKSFDALKLFTIFCVLLGHVILHLQNYQFHYSENSLYRAISSFHMPLFMTISGFFGANVMDINIKKFFYKKGQQLLIPALSFGIIFCISWHYIGGGEIIKTYFLCFWFLKSLFICSILYYFSANSKYRNLLFFTTLIISQFCFPYQVNRMYPAFLIGVYIRQHYDWFKFHLKTIFIISSLIFVPMALTWDADLIKTPIMRPHIFLHMDTEKIITITYAHYYRIVMGIAGSIMFISLFLTGAKFFPNSKIGDTLCEWGQYTLGIYLLQAVIIEHWMMRYIDLSAMDFAKFNYIISPLISIATLLLCIGIIHLIHKSNILSFLILGKKNPSNTIPNNVNNIDIQ